MPIDNVRSAENKKNTSSRSRKKVAATKPHVKKARDTSRSNGKHVSTEKQVSTEKNGPAAETLEFSSMDQHLFNEGRHFRLYRKLGAHLQNGSWTFTVWAPNAACVSVVGDWNGWGATDDPLHPVGSSGVWSATVDNCKAGQNYKLRIQSKNGDYTVDKSDPFATFRECPPATASSLWQSEYSWRDSSWMEARGQRQKLDQPMSFYEMHIGSWKRKLDGDHWVPLTYRELADELPGYLAENGFTHVELLPIMEHPFYGSWGYQVTGYFAPTARYGTPDDFRYLIDALHQANIGVILDWVPSHFPSDEHGPSYFDGTHLFEHADPRQGFHPDWNSLIYNYGRNEVRSFLISNALYWLDEFHIDGLRVDAVASMLYLDYSRKEGEWIPNEFGGRENLEAIGFLKQLNEACYEAYPDIITIAEESTSWPMVSRPTYLGGLGFGMKWDMGWMHDTLQYFQKDPIYRRHHQGSLTFRMVYAFHENFVLSLSHDEVVHGKGSMINKMPGDEWQQFANLRALYCYMFAQPGKKLVFMGQEFGQRAEWNHDLSLDWHLRDNPLHQGLASFVRDLNKVYCQEPGLQRKILNHLDLTGLQLTMPTIVSWLLRGEVPMVMKRSLYL